MNPPRRLMLCSLAWLGAAVSFGCGDDGADPTPQDAEVDRSVLDAVPDVVEDATPDAWVPSPVLSTWTTVAPVSGDPVAFQRVVALDGRLFVLGGRTLNDGPLAPGGPVTAVYAYDPATDMWEAHTDMPVELDQPNIAAAAGKIWILGGRGEKRVFSYDPATRAWEENGERPVALDIGASAMAVLGSSIYVAGGVIASATNPRGSRVTTFDVFDSTNNTWQPLPDMLAESGYFGATVIQDVMYTNGGSTEMGAVARPGQTFAFDLNTLTWTEKALAPAPVSSFSVAQVDRRMYIIGGITGSSGRINFEVQVYDPASDTWAFTTDMRTPRFSAGAAALDGKIYVVGGVEQVSDTEFEATTIVEVLGP
ncbi:MAG: kelch repeat-containing protein [Myxococcota bacterium]